MHFKTFVLRTPSVPPQMMSLAFGGREVVKWVVGFFCLMPSPSCGARVVISHEWKGREGSKLGCRQLFITEPGDNVAHNRRPWYNCADVVCWVRDRRRGTDTWDVTRLQMRVLRICVFGACSASGSIFRCELLKLVVFKLYI